MFVRFSLFAGFVAAIVAIGTARAKTQRDLEYTNPNDGKTYGFVECRWKTPPRIQERAGTGGMQYSIRGAKAECLADAPRGPYVTSADWTEVENVRCDNPKREALTARYCLRQHAGRLQARDGYFTFVHPERSETSPKPTNPASRRGSQR